MQPTDSAPPAGFDGAQDAWHAHERLANVPGRHLVMMHLWFVDTPDGPFARYNPWLPYLAAGLAPPSAAELARPESGERARRLGLALSLATAPPLLFQMIEMQTGEAFRARTATHRAALDSAVRGLVAAERAGSATRERLADDALTQADSLVALYRGAAPDRPLVGRLVDRTVDEFLGRGHGVEEELDALFGRGAGRRDHAP